MSNKHPNLGSSFDDFLREEGIYEEVKRASVSQVLAWQLKQLMEDQHLTKTQMSERMNTSRTQLARVLRGDSNVTVETLQRAATVVGRQLKLELIAE